MSPETCMTLATHWYARRLERDSRRKTLDEAEAIFSALGLEGEFWRLRP